MLGFLFGTACLIGLVRVLRGPCRSSGWSHWRRADSRRGWRGPPPGLRFGPLSWLSRRLETTPGQERVLLSAWQRLEQALAKVRVDGLALAGNLAGGLRAERLDRDALQQQISAAHAELVHLEEAVLDAAADLHEALEPEQRRRLADLLERAGDLHPPCPADDAWGEPRRTTGGCR